MDFLNVIEAFMKQQQKENQEATSITYKSKIYAFHEYVTVILEARDINFSSVLSAMPLERLLESVAYYVKIGNIKFRSTTDIYFTVLGNFFRFISLEYGWNNIYFQSNENFNLFKAGYENKVKELGLLDSRLEEPINEDMARRILQQCENKIKSINIEDIIQRKKGIYTNYISALTTKLVLIYGLKNNVIKSLKKGDYDDRLNKITVNGYKVALPDTLALQMKDYIGIRETILGSHVCDRLFFDYNDLERELDNTKMFAILNNVMGNNQARSVAKYAIIQMIRNGIPAHVIMDFSGYKGDVFQHCQEKVDEEKGILMIREKCKVLDSGIRKSDLFDDI